MFCPNCGQDCGSAKFCSGCGQNLLGKMNAENNGTGKAYNPTNEQCSCPECHSSSVAVYEDNHIANEYLLYRSPVAKLIAIIAQLVRNKREKTCGVTCVCLNCDHRWYPKMRLLHEKHMKHISKLLRNNSYISFGGVGGTYITLDEHWITIYKSPTKKCAVQYEDLVSVDHRKGIGPSYGRLSLRDKKHRKKALPKTLARAQNDGLTILYDPSFAKGYELVNAVLNAIVAENRKAEVV